VIEINIELLSCYQHLCPWIWPWDQTRHAPVVLLDFKCNWTY